MSRRSRLDFVPPGTVAGQITSVSVSPGSGRTRYRDGPDGALPIVEPVPGVGATITLAGHPFVYRVRAIEPADGPQLVDLHIDSPDGQDVPLTPSDLRKLARYLDRLAHAATHPDPSTDAFLTPEKPPPKRPGPHGHPDSFYADVAEFAKQAHRDRKEKKNGLSVRQAIAGHYQVTTDTANKWLARARKFGHLQAGELGGRPRKDTGR